MSMNLPSIQQTYRSLPAVAKSLNISEYKLRKAVMRGEIRSKRSTGAARARFLFKDQWVEQYVRYLESPTLLKRIRAWFRTWF